MAIIITDMRLCAGGNHVIFTAVDENGNDASFSRDVAELSPEEIPNAKAPHDLAMDEAVAKIKEAGAISFDEMKDAILKAAIVDDVKGGKV